MPKKYIPKTKEELENLLFKETWEKDSISFKETDINLADIDTRYITNMSGLFNGALKRTDFSGIESWDTSNVVDMSRMFLGVENFNANIGSWNVSKVKNMDFMFFGAKKFNQSLDKWDISNVEAMKTMFQGSPLQNNPPKWYKTKSNTKEAQNANKL